MCYRSKVEIATVTHLHGTRGFSVYGLHATHDKVDIVKASAINRMYLHAHRSHIPFKEAHQIAPRERLLIDGPSNIRSASNMISRTRVSICVRNAGCMMHDRI